MTNEFEQAALAYQKSSLEWQQRYNIAIASRNAQLDAYTASLDALIISEGQRDQAIAERDKLAARLEAAIELEAEVSGANRRLRAERDALRVLVESAYREGFYDGEDDAPIGELPAGYGDTAWWMSDARKALEVQA
jgi:hypothetical protein